METITRQELQNLLGAFNRVENAPSRNGYSTAPNQFIVKYDNGEVFQSYKSLIGARINGHYYFTKDHNYSQTTSKHCKAWCGYGSNERKHGLEDGTFTMITD